MRKLIYVLLLINYLELFGQTPLFTSALQVRGNKLEVARQIEYDGEGNSYHMISSSSDAISVGSVNIPANPPSGGSRYTTVLVKFNKNQEVIWSIKDNLNTQFGYFFIDNFNNIYLNGSVEGGSFQYGINSITSAPGNPISFILKINTDKNIIWLKKNKLQFSNSCHDKINIYMFNRSLKNDTIDNFIFRVNISYLIKFDTSGIILKKVDLGTIPDIRNMNCRNGKLYISGEYDLDTKTDTTVWKLPKLNYPTIFTVSEAYLASFDTSLQLNWVKTSRSTVGNFQFFGFAASAKSFFTKIAPNGDLISFGTYVADTVYFENIGISTGQNALSQEAGRYNMYLNCYDSLGNVKWARAMGSNRSEYALGLAIDSLSNITIAGYGDTTIDNFQDLGFFIIKFNKEGRHCKWRKSIASQGINRWFNSLECDNKGNYYLNGYFWKYNTSISPLLQLDTINLTLSTAATNAPTQPDLFIGKIGRCNLNPPSLSVTSPQTICQADSQKIVCTSFQNYQWNTGETTQNITIKKAGRYHCYIYDSLGCYAKSNVVEVKVNQPTASNISQSICPGASFLGYSQAGTYKDTLVGINGCDSVRTLTLTIKPIRTGSLAASICPGQTFSFGSKILSAAGIFKDTITSSIGCDSIRTLTLSIKPKRTFSQSIRLCKGQTLMVGPKIYTRAGIYQDTLTASNGCDSLINSTLNYDIPNDSITVNGLSFSAAGGQDGYQWLACNQNFQPISGATQLSFSPTSNGGYAVKVTKGNCADTSVCVLFTSAKYLVTGTIRIYPQPVQDKLYIEMPSSNQPSELIMQDALGRTVVKEKGQNIQSISVVKLPAGLYQLKVWSGKEMQLFGVMVER